MKAIVGAKILLPEGVMTDKALLFSDKIIGLVDQADIGGAQVIDAGGLYAAPGLVDTHIHGYLGEDASDGSAEGIRKMARGILRNGVTSWLPTTMTVGRDQLREVFAMMRGLREDSRDPLTWQGAEILGVNAEGPFINPAKKGAQAAENIQAPDAALIREYADIIRVFTIAPEMPGGLDAIRRLKRDTGVLISIGHTAADYDQTIEAIHAGVGTVTHLFNAMTPLMHRDPGVVGAALTTDVYTEMIADNFHIHPALYGLVQKLKGDKLVLITDCTRAGGLAEGEYTLGGQTIYVKGVECRLADGTIAGSVLKLNHAVRNVAKQTELPLYKVVNMASLHPAREIGVADRKGSLEAGKDADIILVDADMEVQKVFAAGQLLFDEETEVR